MVTAIGPGNGDQMRPALAAAKVGTPNTDDKDRLLASPETVTGGDRVSRAGDEHSERMEQLARQLCRAMERRGTRLSFFLHQPTDQVGVRVVDVQTREVIRELPPEAQLDLAVRIRDMVGRIVDREV